MSRKVIDLSKWNGNNPINWKSVKKNVDGVILRIGLRGYMSTGTLKKDPMFDYYVQNCIEHDIPFGVYWFAQEISKKEAIESANFIYNIIKDYKLSYPVYYDVEYSGEAYKRGRADVICDRVRNDCIVAFCDEIKRLGFIPGVYANESWFTSIIDRRRVKNYSIWCAKYNNNSGNPEIPPKITYDMWQYTNKGRITGITGNVDISQDISARITDNMIQDNTTTGNAVKTIDDIASEVIEGLWGNGDKRKDALTKAGYDYNIVQKRVNVLIDISECDIVKLTSDAVYSDGKPIPQWVKNSKLFVRSRIRENGDVVLSTDRQGDITGVVNKKYLIKIDLGL